MSSEQNPILEANERLIDPNIEEEMDLEVMKVVRNTPMPSKKDDALIFLALILNYIVHHAGEYLNQEYTNQIKNAETLRRNPELVDLLKKCIQNEKFRDIRNLKFLQPKIEHGFERVRKDHPELHLRLLITLEAYRWTALDVGNNSAYLLSSPDEIPQDIIDLKNQLGLKRTYTDRESAEMKKDRTLASLRYQEQFSWVFTHGNTQTVSYAREYVSLFNLFHSYMPDAVPTADSSASTFKSSTFCTFFIHPALCYPIRKSALRYQENETWEFPLFVRFPDSNVYRYTPRNDWSVKSVRWQIPLVISEVSQKDESDGQRMLLQAVVLARLGRWLSKERYRKEFFVVAIYFSADLNVRRYIVKAKDDNPQSEVCIVLEVFDLHKPKEAAAFFLEMLNLSAKLHTLDGNFDSQKAGKLGILNQAAKSMRSFTNVKDKQRKSKKSESREGSSLRFSSTPVTRVLGQHNLYISSFFHDDSHPNIALVFDKTTDLPTQYLKFIKKGSEELEFLKDFAQIDSPYNHVVRPIHSWTIEDGAMVLLPHGGKRIDDLRDLPKHLLDVVRQLFEGVDFLHIHNVAHLDLKPSNILVQDATGRLTIIDFDASVYLQRRDDKVKGLAGTKGYMAPEVGQGRYDPIRADLFSCGVVVKELCEIAGPCREQKSLMIIASCLMDPEPQNRPTMSQVLTWLDDIQFFQTYE